MLISDVETAVARQGQTTESGTQTGNVVGLNNDIPGGPQ
jgi:hypothetical protein